MWTLGFDTTAGVVTAALLDGETVAFKYSCKSSTSHSTTLLPAIEDMLRKAEISVKDLGLISCSAGPGSFTGVRIGTSTAKGLAAPHGIPCVGVSSLEAMAYMFGSTEGIVCPALIARRGNVYTALFRSDGKGNVTRLTPDDLVAISVLGEFAAQTDGTITVTGDANDEVLASLTDAGLDAEIAPVGYELPSGFGAALAGRKKYLESDDKSVFTAKALMPIYLRKSQAERELDKTGYKA